MKLQFLGAVVAAACVAGCGSSYATRGEPYPPPGLESATDPWPGSPFAAGDTSPWPPPTDDTLTRVQADLDAFTAKQQADAEAQRQADDARRQADEQQRAWDEQQRQQREQTISPPSE